MGTILVVDDDAAVLRAVDRVLSTTPHDVILAESGADAVEVVARQRVDLVITDINMPGMDGIELLVQIREGSPDTHVVAISGGGRIDKEDLVTDAGMLGAAEAITKPFDPDYLLGIVDRLLSG